MSITAFPCAFWWLMIIVSARAGATLEAKNKTIRKTATTVPKTEFFFIFFTSFTLLSTD
jgi:hypothetical protein